MAISTQKKSNEFSPQEGASFTHLIPALLTLLILAGALIYGDRYSSSLENEYVHTLAPLLKPQVNNGIVIQQAALRQPDLLPVYGSSEMINTATDLRAIHFFSDYPTGFMVMDIAKAGDTSLNLAQNLATLGSALKGKKVVISFTSAAFNFPKVNTDAYAANFSSMHALGLIFSPYLSVSVKEHAAKRMLEYPETLIKDPILNFAIQNLASDTFTGNVSYALIYPLGQLENLVIRMQDHYAIKQLMNLRKTWPKVKYRPRTIDWDALIAQVNAQEAAKGTQPTLPKPTDEWARKYPQIFSKNPTSSDATYLHTLENSKEWDDLKILLEVLKQLDARPLMLSRPINGFLYSASGISQSAQLVYYTKLEEMVTPYHFPLVDFREYINDPYFSVDIASHTGPKGWAIVDQTLDAFYHDTLGK
jgi:D-alanine transfer protein